MATKEIGVTKFTVEQQAKLERLVEFNEDGGFSILGDVEGNIFGNVRGNIWDNVLGDIVGNVKGYVGGDVEGNVLGNVLGDIRGNVIGYDLRYCRKHLLGNGEEKNDG